MCPYLINEMMNLTIRDQADYFLTPLLEFSVF